MTEKFREWIIKNEKSGSTVKQYVREAKCFLRFCQNEVTKEKVIEYKEYLKERYAPTSVNAKIAAVNSYLEFEGKKDLRVKAVKIQRNMYAKRERFLTKDEYLKLLEKCKDERLYLLLQTICASGIRVSEIKFITVEAVKSGFVNISLKGKVRVIFVPKKLCRALLKYAKKHGIENGSIFVTKNGKELDRSNIWREMKKLSEKAGVDKRKVFPHNLRHLFARTFYKTEKDIVKLSDILGHSSINTTRIYTMETGEEHRKCIERLGLVSL